MRIEQERLWKKSSVTILPFFSHLFLPSSTNPYHLSNPFPPLFNPFLRKKRNLQREIFTSKLCQRLATPLLAEPAVHYLQVIHDTGRHRTSATSAATWRA